MIRLYPVFLSILLLTLLLITACSSAGKKSTISGDRVSVLELQTTLEPDPTASEESISLPAMWNNDFWPQDGGYPDHAMRHMAFNNGEFKRLWRADIGDGSEKTRRLITQPIVVNDTIFTLDTKGIVSAFNTENGKRIWRVSIVPKKEDLTALTGGLAYGEGMLYITDGYGYVLALNPTNGQKIWDYRTKVPARAAPTVAEGRVFVMTIANELIALAANDGSVLWRHNGIQETAGLMGAPSPAYADGRLVVTYSSGEVFALNGATGQSIWTDNLASVRAFGAMGRMAGVQGLPIIDNGIVFVGSMAGRFVAIDVETGNRLWQREIGTASTPWVAGNVIFVMTTQNELVAFAKDTGKIRWVTPLPRYKDKSKRDDVIVWTRPILAGGRLIIASTNEDMIFINPETGAVMGGTDIPDPVTIAPIVAHNTLFIITDDGDLIAYR